MKEAKYKLGDLVDTTLFSAGEVTEAIWRASKDEWIYEVLDNGTGLKKLFPEGELEAAQAKEYSMDIKIDIAQNVVIATLYESVGDKMMPICKGHGHLIHDGEVGIAQAASYACNRLWRRIGGYDL